nr:PREDICTED: PHD and RING finger domain-containing protein 1-like [Anolis carolinensis]|eukprot:XP_016848916.1 PREDICTED: PHD and RING finger domain-containing protein 1-like [Anolis carolinensis]
MESGISSASHQQGQTSGGSASTVARDGGSTLPPARGKVGSSSFQSFKINIPGNIGHSSRLSNPGFCNTFRPVDNKVQQKENPSPLFSLKKTKPIKSEIYDPFDPTGSDSSSTNSSPERLPFANITRTISIASPKAQTFQTVRRITPYNLENIFGLEAESTDVPSATTESCDDVMLKERLVEQVPDAVQVKHEEEELPVIPCTSSAIKQEHILESNKNPGLVIDNDQDKLKLQIYFTSVEEKYSKSSWVKSKARQPPRDRSSSHERSRKKKAKDKTKDKKAKSSWPKEHKRARSRSVSPGNSSFELYENRKKKKHSDPGVRGREYSHSNNAERTKKKKHRRERSYDRLEKDGSSRSRERKRSRSRSQEKRKRKSRSPSSRSQESKGSKPRERQLPSRSRSKERKHKSKEVSPQLLKEEGQRSSDDNLDCSLEHAPNWSHELGCMSPETLNVPSDLIPEQEVPPEDDIMEADLKGGIKTEQVCEELEHETLPAQQDHSSSEVFLDNLDSPTGIELAVGYESPRSDSQITVKMEEIEIKIEDDDVCPFFSDSVLLKKGKPVSGHDEVTPFPTLSEIKRPTEVKCELPMLDENIGDANKSELEAAVQGPLLKSKAPVKRVTWNLQEEESNIAAADKTPRMAFCKQQRTNEGVWKAEDLTQTLNQVQLTEPLPTNYMVPEPMFPDLDSNQVYNQNLPLMAPLPSNLPPYAPVSQPTVQFIMQGSLPLLSCVASQGLTPEPGNLATASEPGIQAASTGEAEETVKTPKSPVDKTKNEEYMKKLHMQERAVEEVKLAIKPFYQKREITKEEYKEILRKAVQKICHSKSGEINPVKVANLVKAYVEKYKHMRKHKKTDAEEEPRETGN